MKSILMRITLISLSFVLLIPDHASAGFKTFIKEYNKIIINGESVSNPEME